MRLRVYGSSRPEAPAKLTEKIAAGNRSVPVVTAQGSLALYLTSELLPGLVRDPVRAAAGNRAVLFGGHVAHGRAEQWKTGEGGLQRGGDHRRQRP
jgi:hypothetical protein